MIFAFSAMWFDTLPIDWLRVVHWILLFAGGLESTLTVCGLSEEDYFLSVGGCQEYSRVWATG
jgi:hypothetical protein